MDRVERPLSPHWTVYSWRITNGLSIVHRATGVFLSIGALVLVWWLIALASGPQAYQSAQQLLGSTWFKAPLIGWTFCFFFHLANGIRHLFWDMGLGFEPRQFRASGWGVVIVAALATAGYSLVAIV